MPYNCVTCPKSYGRKDLRDKHYAETGHNQGGPETVECRYCKDPFHPSGVGPHEATMHRDEYTPRERGWLTALGIKRKPRKRVMVRLKKKGGRPKGSKNKKTEFLNKMKAKVKGKSAVAALDKPKTGRWHELEMLLVNLFAKKQRIDNAIGIIEEELEDLRRKDGLPPG